MADNVNILDATGTAFSHAFDDISSVFYPRVKVVWGADGSATDVSAAAPLPVVTAGGYGGTPLTVTRPADTTAYTAGDVVGGVLTFPSMGPSGGRIVVNSASLLLPRGTAISGETTYRLYLYNVTPPSALADNAPWDLPSGDRAAYRTYIPFTPEDLGSTLVAETAALNKQIALSGTSLFGYLVTTGAYTPTSADTYVITLNSIA